MPYTSVILINRKHSETDNTRLFAMRAWSAWGAGEEPFDHGGCSRPATAGRSAGVCAVATLERFNPERDGREAAVFRDNEEETEQWYGLADTCWPRLRAC